MLGKVSLLQLTPELIDLNISPLDVHKYPFCSEKTILLIFASVSTVRVSQETPSSVDIIKVPELPTVNSVPFKFVISVKEYYLVVWDLTKTTLGH